MKKAKPLEVALMAVLSLAAAYLLNRFWAVLEGLPAGNPIERLLDAVDAIIPSIGAAPLSIGVSKASLLAGACGFGMVWLMYLYRLAAPKRMYGIEHGSAEWGSRRDSAPLRSKDPDQNIVLSATEQISMGQAKNYEHDRNKNVIVVGGSGSGKTVLVKENLMQLHSSYVITDPKGTLLPQTGYLFTKNGWKVRNFNTINFKKSLHYNPLAYPRAVLFTGALPLQRPGRWGRQWHDLFFGDCRESYAAHDLGQDCCGQHTDHHGGGLPGQPAHYTRYQQHRFQR